MVNDTQQIPAGYKQTDVGVIPNSWKALQIRDVAKYRRGSFPQPYGLPQWYDEIGGKPFIQVVDVGENCRLKKTTKQKLSKKAEKYSVFVKKGSVIITIQGSIGRVAVTDYDAYMDRTLLLFESFNVPVDVHFLKYALQVLFEKEKQSAPGGIIKTITKEALSSFVLQIPPIEEQSLISNSLSDIDSLISKLDQLIQKKKNIKQGAMQELLTGKRRLPGFSGEWEEIKLGDVSTIRTGKKDVNEGNPEGKYPFFTCSRTISYSNSFSFDTEAILIAGNGEVGNLHLFKGKFEAYQRTYVLSDFEVNTSFLWHQMSFFFKKSLGIGTIGSSIPYIKKENIVDFIFLSPRSPDEQNAIANVISDFDKEIMFLEQRRNKYQNLKQGMMQQLLTGKIRLI